MPNIQKLKTPDRKRLLASLLPVALAALSGALMLGVGSTAALQTQAGLDASNNVAATQKYCKSKMPKSVDSLCTTNNMNSIRAAVDSGCTGTNKAGCVENTAEGVIDQIAKTSPKNASDFNKALDTATKAAATAAAAKAAAASPAAGAGGGGHSIATAGDQSNISAGSLPKPTADSSTIQRILQFVFGLIGAFAVLNITFSGLKYITSAGNEQKTAEAKNGIVYSLVGLAIAITAEGIVAFVVSRAST